MATSDLIKLAPTLSAEERYKILVPDMQRVLMGEKPLIAESERKAIIHFENRAVWEEYTQKINMLQWAQALWPKDIEAEKLRVLACSLILSHALEKLLLDGDEPIPKEKRTAQFEQLKDRVAMFEKLSITFYAYKEAISAIQQELYGVPLLPEDRMEQIMEYYDMADWLIDHHNETIHGICGNEIIKKTIKPIVRDMNSYLIKRPVPDLAVVEQIVDEIRQTAALEVQQ